MNDKTKISIETLTPETAAELISKSGSKRPKSEIESVIRRMIESGAPTNPDGTIHFLKLVAFMEGRRNGKF